ncbi:EAL domain-containing protein [Sphingomonas hengshuiensis]|uniref:EAL domain-containing protein n=1 Tax=Sphingomonas hengshuiensis TaxID=1609977 RepID=UPI000A95B4EB|nr:EAL domain-containing protein [Sphingomonas hengshuiensis]
MDHQPRGAARAEQDFDVAMAFQPILDAHTGMAFAYEALVRGRRGESAAEMLGRVTPATRYTFDQQCRVAAIEQAVAAGIIATGARLSINFMPDTVDDPVADSQRTLRAARETGFPPDRLIFEFSDQDRLDGTRMARVTEAYRRMGMATAFDDFGAGADGVRLLSRFTPDAIKLDPALVRGLCGSWSRRLAVENIVQLATGLGITVIAEGVETRAEYEKLCAIGVRYLQGYFIARPQRGILVRPELPLPALADRVSTRPRAHGSVANTGESRVG